MFTAKFRTSDNFHLRIFLGRFAIMQRRVRRTKQKKNRAIDWKHVGYGFLLLMFEMKPGIGVYHISYTRISAANVTYGYDCSFVHPSDRRFRKEHKIKRSSYSGVLICYHKKQREFDYNCAMKKTFSTGESGEGASSQSFLEHQIVGFEKTLS